MIEEVYKVENLIYIKIKMSNSFSTYTCIRFYDLIKCSKNIQKIKLNIGYSVHIIQGVLYG